MKADIKVKSLYKALMILECFSVDTPELGITEISKQLGLYKSSVHNMVDTFVKAGYLERNQHNEKYRLSFKILELGNVISSNISFVNIVLPHMQALADNMNEIVYLGVPSEGEVVYLDSASPRNKHSARKMLGVKAPLYCTGIGKAMLAFMPEQAVDAALSGGLKPYTDHTIVDQAKLREELAAIRRRGYSVDNMEHEFGIKCVGMPLLNRRREVVAGVSISGPSPRFDERMILEFARGLRHIIESVEGKM